MALKQNGSECAKEMDYSHKDVCTGVQQEQILNSRVMDGMDGEGERWDAETVGACMWGNRERDHRDVFSAVVKKF